MLADVLAHGGPIDAVGRLLTLRRYRHDPSHLSCQRALCVSPGSILLDSERFYKHSRTLVRAGQCFCSIYLISTKFLSMRCEMRTIVA
jgi:hypothetical protein